MKEYIVGCICCWLIGCSGTEKGSSQLSGNLSYTLDTILIDSGEEILFLNSGLYGASLSPDKRFLYNYNVRRSILEQVDLQERKLVGLYPFEEEGPNGVGRNVQSVQKLDDDLIFISGYGNYGIFNLLGEKQVTIDLDPSTLRGDSLSGGESLYSSILATPHGLYGVFTDFRIRSLTFGVVNIPARSFMRVDLPDFRDYSAFYLSLVNEAGNPMIINGPGFDLVKAGEYYVLTNTVDSRWYFIDSDKGAVSNKDVAYEVIDRERTVGGRTAVTSMDEYQLEMTELEAKINHQRPIWNEEHECFYRFSSKAFLVDDAPNETPVKRYEVFLAILDKEANVLTEISIPELQEPSRFQFFKDGKIWIFENIEDEMGFVRLSFDF